MGQKALVIDVTKCTACFDCLIACKDEFAGQAWPPYSEAQPDNGQQWIFGGRDREGTVPSRERHFCAATLHALPGPAMCQGSERTAPPTRGTTASSSSIPRRARDRKELVSACRYGRVYWNEELQIPQKCDFCAHLLDKGWKEPRCVEVCPARVFTFGEKDELTDLIAKAEQLHPEYSTGPAVYYIGLPKTFISGSVFCDASKDCLEDAEVTLAETHGGAALTAKTNNYGDFEFDGLKVGTTYRLAIAAPGYYQMTLDGVRIEKDLHLGNLYLKKSRW